MTYICHDTVKTTPVQGFKGWMSEFAGWLQATLASPSGNRLDPRNEHLQRDIGIHVADVPGIFKSGPPSGGLPHSAMDNNIRFVDLFLSEHLDRGPR